MVVRYFYANERKNGKYIVFKTDGEYIDKEEHKAMTIAKNMGLTLAGGYFAGKSKPFDFKQNYHVIQVPKNTKLSPKTEKEKYVEDIIRYEQGEMSYKKENEFLRKNKNDLIKLQGHYGRKIKRRNI